MCHRREDDCIWPEAHADDILTAFGGTRRDLAYMDMVDHWSASEKAQIKEHIRDVVDAWVDRDSIWNDIEHLLNTPMHYTSAPCNNAICPWHEFCHFGQRTQGCLAC